MSREEDEQRRRFREQRQREADQRRQAALDAAAQAEEAALGRYNKDQDDEFEDAFKDILGYSVDDVRKYVTHADDPQVSRILNDAGAAAARGKTGKAKRILRANKKAIRSSVDAGKKKGGCLVISVLVVGGLVAAFGSAGWLAIDTIGALVK